MEPSEKIEKLIKSARVETRAQTDRHITDKAKEVFIETRQASEKYRPRLAVWRIIMKSRIMKLSAAAVILLIGISGAIILDRLATPAWAIEQTIKALGKIRTLVICGEDNWGSEIIPFKFQIRFSEDDNGQFDMRYESAKQIIVVRGTKAWAYRHDENTVKIYEDVTSSSDMMRDLRFWYKIAELNPWITGKMLAALKLFADDWQEIYEKDEQTGQERVFVNCSFKPLSSSFWFVCDTESKLIVEGKYWRNTEHEGPPVCHAKSFAYNEELSEEVFDFQIPEGAKVINRNDEQEADILFARGEKLFEGKNFTEAIKVYREAYEKYPNLNVAETSLMMTGVCYGQLGEREKAISTFEKTIREYGDMKGWIESTYFYLGCAYMDEGQKDKALAAFQNCIIMGEGIRDPDKFPLKNARENIERLKKKK